MFFPIPMQIETGTKPKTIPIANWLLIAINVLAWLFVTPESWWVGPGTGLLSVLTYGFVHAGFLHLLFNLWFLWLFGNAINRRIGNGYFLMSYLGSVLLVGLVGRLLCSGYMLGASGGVFAVMGMAFLLIPGARIEIHYLLTLPLTFLVGLIRPPGYSLFWFVRWGKFSTSVLLGMAVFVVLELMAILWGGLNWSNLGHLIGFCGGIGSVLVLPEAMTLRHHRQGA